MQAKIDIKNYTLEDLRELFVANNFAKYQASQVFSWIYEKKAEEFSLMTNISKEKRVLLEERFFFSALKTIEKELSQDKTQKFLFSLEDKSKIEAVYIPEKERATLCISSQVGCKFNCQFCLSGKLGFKRNLKTSEIVNQYLEVSKAILPFRITNLVFMGIGEPLDNFSNVIKAIEIFMAPSGIGFGKRKICISTCGLAEEIEKLAHLKLGVKLSVSLHSADDEIRSKLMPINKKYPLKELSKAVKNFAKSEDYPVTFEYALIHGVNTGKEDARKLIKFVHGINCKINLIPCNETCFFTDRTSGKKPSRTMRLASLQQQRSLTELSPKGITPERSEWGNESSLEFSQPQAEEIDLFCRELKNSGVFFTLRKPRGQDISAACGQLVASWS